MNSENVAEAMNSPTLRSFIVQEGGLALNLKPDIFRRFDSGSRPLVVFLILAIISGALLIFASEVMEGETLAFDRWILLALRSPANPAMPVGPKWLRHGMADITALGGYTVLIMITGFAVGYLIAVRKAMIAAYLAGSVISGSVLSSLLKLAYLRPRPDIVAHLVTVQSSSFPSGHATNAAVTYLTLGIFLCSVEQNRGARIYLMCIAVFLTIAVGISRIYLGVHWPSDVLAGWCIGSIWAVLCSILMAKLQALPAVPQAED